MRSPEHPDLSDWVDYVRGLGAPEVRGDHAAHLAGCDRCRRTVAQFGAVAAVAHGDAELTPGAAAIRLAESIAVQFRPVPMATLPRLVARLLGGGSPAPALAGLRGAAGAAREAEWEAGPFGLRVRVEREPQSPMLSIVGQLEPRRGTDATASGLPVLVTSGRHVVVRASTNEFGEFVLSCDPAPRLRLHVGIEGESRRVSVPLARLVRGEAR